MEKVTMEKIVNVCKQYGFIFQGSEIYDGLANTWDYGPLGVEFKNNVKRAWWKRFVQESKNSYGVDAAILMNPRVWEASGHVGGFTDPLIDCKSCKARHRADHLIEGFTDEVVPDTMTDEEMVKYINDNKIPCPKCGKSDYTDIREFNLMFETNRGVVKDATSKVYLRPETAQGEFVNFLNVQRTMRAKVPFGIGQIGKAFRNEITPGNFTFRTIEFEQMEHQLFCKDGTDSDFPFGFSELWGTHNRTNYDLSRHQEYSKKSMEYLDPETNEKYIPFVIESSVGCDRLALALLCDAYHEEEVSEGDTREVMKFIPALAPFKATVLPLVKKYHSEKAEEVYEMLSKNFMTSYDEAGSIGKRYRRSDAIGTPYCITIDDETINNNTVTIRDRDTMKQITISVDEIVDYINERIKF